MVNSKTPSVLVSMPKTSWQEPARAPDNLLKRPKGRPYKATEVLQELPPPESLATKSNTHALISLSVPSGDPSPIEGKSQLVIDNQATATQPLSTPRLAAGMDNEYNGAAEDGNEPQLHLFSDFADQSGAEAAEQGNTVNGIGASVAEDQIPASSVLAALDDDELLVGVERDTEDEDQESDIALSVQTNTTASTHTGSHFSRTCIHQAKTLREGTESIRPHPTDASKVIVTYQYTSPEGNNYIQETEMPEVVVQPTNAAEESGSIIVPDVEASKVPRTKKGSPWVPVPGTSRYEWTRGNGNQQETWRIAVFFRRLNRGTHEYEDIYINTGMLTTVDPNDIKFRTSYNKWVLQFARRRDATYTNKVARVHWNVAERRALYTTVNAFCAMYGVNNFGFTNGCKLSANRLQAMADTVNTVANPLRAAPRGIDAVRGQIISAHAKAQPKNKEIFDLRVKAAALRARIDAGEIPSRAERKPQFAIPLSEFPVNPPAAATAPSTVRNKKRKRTAVVEDTEEQSSSGMSSPPESEPGEDKWMTTDEEILPDEGDDDNWTDADEEATSSPPAKRLRL